MLDAKSHHLWFACWEPCVNPPHQLDGIVNQNPHRQSPPATHARIVEVFSRLFRSIVENETPISMRLRRTDVSMNGGWGV
jgi:hypothetical protein